MKKIIALLSSLIILVSFSFAREGKINLSVSYAHEFYNIAGTKNNSETTYSNGLRLHIANESFIGMNAILQASLPYSTTCEYNHNEMGKPKAPQPYKVSLIAGPVLNLPINSFIKVYASIGLKGSLEIVNTTTTKERRKDMMVGLGIGGNMGLKLFSDKKINMILGTDIYYDFYRTGTMIPSYIPTVSVGYSPYIGVGFTL